MAGQLVYIGPAPTLKSVLISGVSTIKIQPCHCLTFNIFALQSTEILLRCWNNCAYRSNYFLLERQHLLKSTINFGVPNLLANRLPNLLTQPPSNPRELGEQCV
jgi:hypothetical protein